MIRRLPGDKIPAALLTNAFLLASASLTCSFFFSPIPGSSDWDCQGSIAAFSKCGL